MSPLRGTAGPQGTFKDINPLQSELFGWDDR